MSDTDWRERALRAEVRSAKFERERERLMLILCPEDREDLADALRGIVSGVTKMGQDLASVTAQRDAAVETLSWFVRWHEAVPAREFIPGPINVGIAKARQALADRSSILQRREREKAVIEAARRCVPPNGARSVGGDPGSGALRALHEALASLDTEGASNAG